MTAATPRDGGPVDQYLDELFGRLAGTGTGGRRLLMETEAHLTEAVAEACARGLDHNTAEREAVHRFGPAATVVRHLPATAGALGISLRRLAVAAWALTGTALAWYGLTGAATRLLSWPWARLLISTDRFGAGPMCERPWIPADAGGCLAVHRQLIDPVPWGGARFPYPLVAIIGLSLIVSLVIVRRVTGLGAPPWTPPRNAAGLTFAVPFGAVALLLLFYGTVGLLPPAQNYALSYLTAGLTAAAISMAALRYLRRPHDHKQATEK